ncbi:hypothetical protein [Streptomyces sp. NPDC048659]|uniref:hypothetical protein n=1 Tax=Streptomyces sp. NPDC048659 TaxID=3155489 RepID=UPI0034263D77
MRVLFYYPLVSPPSEVVHEALLYWDGLASVVPRDREVARAATGPELRELRERGLYLPMSPYGSSAPDLFDPGLRERIAEELDRLAARQAVAPEPFDAYINSTKWSWRLEEHVLSLGLGTRLPGRWSLAVTSATAHTVIGAAARIMAARESRGTTAYIPYTDRPLAHRAARELAAGEPGRGYEAELGRLLPLPAPGTPLPALLAFRERHADERHRLVRAVHRLLGELRRDYAHPAEVLAELERELTVAAADYRAAGTALRLAWRTRLVTVAVALAGAAGGAAALPGWATVVAATAGAYAINVATSPVRPLRARRDEHDFAYLHRVRAELG